MSTSSSIDFELASKLNSMGDLLNALEESGWLIHHEGYVEFLPLGDNADFCWQREKLKRDDLVKLLEEKWTKGELIGLITRHREGDTGGELLVRQEGVVSLILSINRREIAARIGLTDVSWYLEKLSPIFSSIGQSVETIHWTENI